MLPASRLIFFLATLTVAASVCPPNFQGDIVFLVDSDGATDQDKYHCFYDFIIELLENFHLGKNLTRVGLVSQDTLPMIKVPLTGDKDVILQQIRNIEYRHNKVDAIMCMHTALTLFNSAEPRDKKVKSVVVLETDGTGKRRDTMIQKAKTLKDRDIQVYTFGIKPRVDRDELLGVASKPQYYLEAESYDDYAEFAQDLSDLICDERP
ncbi:hypothetical protein BsWGS_25841 [Bradybaena similaris]